MQLAFKVLNIFRMTCDRNRDCRMRKKHRQTCFEICLGLSTCILGMLIFFQSWKILK